MLLFSDYVERFRGGIASKHEENWRENGIPDVLQSYPGERESQTAITVIKTL
jgi:hypothetical protein